MVVDALALVLAQLNQYLQRADGSPLSAASPAIWGNIAQTDHPDTATALENHVVLTLVNLEEETTLRNSNTFTRDPGGAISYHNAPVHLNLFLLFTAYYRNYETALKRLTQVMTFFQGKQNFTFGNSPVANPSAAQIGEFSLTLDLLSLSFEEVNNLWGSLGGRQLPCVTYRGRLVALRDVRVLEGGGRIQEIQISGRDATR
jgi:hypothetical protein